MIGTNIEAQGDSGEIKAKYSNYAVYNFEGVNFRCGNRWFLVHSMSSNIKSAKTKARTSVECIAESDHDRVCSAQSLGATEMSGSRHDMYYILVGAK